MNAAGSNWTRAARLTLSMLALTLLLAGCTTTRNRSPGIVATGAGKAIPCRTIERFLDDGITFDSETDSAETIRQVRTFNAIFDAACTR